MPTDAADRTFLFLQGPHGPFFDRLGRMLRRTGARVRRVGFNGGDRAFWFDAASYVPYRGDAADWPAAFRDLATAERVTDLVVYGDTRPLHAAAIAEARAAGITVHVFEEGYLRPHWVTYERGGANGHSRLMTMPLAVMRAALPPSAADAPDAPARWGDMRQHVFWGALYHAFVLGGARAYRAWRPHRALTVRQEFALHLKRLLLMPLHRAGRAVATRRIARGGFPYHLALLQLEHDASFRAHGPFDSMTGFLSVVIDGFAQGAPAHHHLVLKAHPLEDGRVDLARQIARLARAAGVGPRVHFLRGGKLAALLAEARSAVTVNSTAAQQALWRGLPVKAFGRAVYAKTGIVSQQPLPAFFADPDRPDARVYRDLRRYLLATSQVPGGFYSRRGRRALLRRVVDRMLAPLDPYDALAAEQPAPARPLRLVH